MNRHLAVAGSFYPSNADELNRELDDCFTNSPDRHSISKPIALVCPHAGYIYSGKAAAAAWKAVPSNYSVESLILLGPNHSGRGTEISVSDSDSWDTLEGSINVDVPLREALCAAYPVCKPDRLAHLTEHSLEVQIPFALRRLSAGFKLLPIAIGVRPDPEGLGKMLKLGQALAEIARIKSVLILASTDMSHYIPAKLARELDFKALDRIVALDAPGLVQEVAINRISMCGVMPTAASIKAAVELGAKHSELTDYRHSGMVTGDNDSVVSYASFVIH